MNERDRKRVENFRKILDGDDPFVHGFSFGVGRQIFAIIERLDKQMANLSEVGQPIRDFVEIIDSEFDDNIVLVDEGGFKGTTTQQIRLGQFRRLAQALRNIGEDKT